MNYNYFNLEEVCSNVLTGGTPLTSQSEYYIGGTIPWLKTKEVNFSRIYNTEYHITEKGLLNSSTKFVPENTVIVAMYGQGDTAGRVAINKIPITTNQACCNLVIDENIADYRFVYYALKNSYKELVAMKNGGAQPNLNTTLIKKFKIPVPSLVIQCSIADILSSYDDLIENSQKQINLLKEAAMRLYKEWFINLRFPGHEDTSIVDGVPEGWSRKSINDLMTFHRGYDLTKKNMQEGLVPVVGSTSIIGYHNEFKMKGPGIVTGRSGSLGTYQLIWEDFWPHNTSLYICDYKDHDIFFVYCLLQTVDFSSLNNGGAIPTLNRNTLSNIIVLEPHRDLQKKFALIAKNIYKKVHNVNKQIALLGQVRDILLPKLMSGEIEM